MPTKPCRFSKIRIGEMHNAKIIFSAPANVEGFLACYHVCNQSLCILYRTRTMAAKWTSWKLARILSELMAKTTKGGAEDSLSLTLTATQFLNGH